MRLHGWCDQSEEKISGLYLRLQEQPDGAAGFERTILESFVRLGSREEKLMALAVLHRLNVAAEKLADLTLLNLENQINEKDGAFILHHYFGDVLPVPSALVYDVTKGNFISYKRALYRALQVSQFDSPFEPAQVLLFLVQLLCRDSLNEQNRAIVYLLISRIDIDLPESVGRIVLAAMARLHGLVDEVERRHEAVLVDEMGPDEATLGDPRPDPATPEAPGKVLLAAAFRESPGAALPVALDDVPTPAGARVPQGQLAPTAKPEPLAAVPGEPGHSPKPLPVSAAPGPTREGWVPAAVPGEAGAVPRTTARAPLDRSLATEPGRWGQAHLEVESTPVPRGPSARGQTEPPPGQSAPSRFVIRFNRDSRELAALVEQVAHPADRPEPPPASGPRNPARRPPDKTPPVAKPVTREPPSAPVPEAPTMNASAANPPPGEPTPEAAAPVAEPVSSVRVARRWPFVAFAAAGLVVAGIALGWGLLSSPTPRSVSAPASQAVATPVVSEPSPPHPALASTWSPRPGESLWTLFQSLGGGHSSLTGLAGLSWGEFVKAIQAANPEITVPNLIFTRQAIRLPAER